MIKLLAQEQEEHTQSVKLRQVHVASRADQAGLPAGEAGGSGSSSTWPSPSSFLARLLARCPFKPVVKRPVDESSLHTLSRLAVDVP